MASYNELNALIDAYINRNGVQAITGQILNGVLKAMVEQLGRGYTIMGAAIPTTDPGTPDGPECYFASETGTYTDFDGLQVAPGELALLCYTPSDGWTKETIYEGFQEVGATIDGNVGTPSVGVSYANGVLSFDFHNMKGNPGQNGQDGAAAGFGTIGADITGGVGTPGVTVESSGPATAKNLQFHFTNLKGETGVTSVVATVDNTTGTPACTVSLVGQQLILAFSGLKGAQGDTGSSVDYPFTIVNNLTTDDATQALSAAQGVVLDGKVTQLEAKVTDLEHDVFGINETAYENEGQVAYYYDARLAAGWNGAGTYTPALVSDTKINQIVFPPFRASVEGAEAKYLIGYRQFDESRINTPKTKLTILAEGIIESVSSSSAYVRDFSITLPTEVTIPAGNQIIVLLYSASAIVYFLGGGDAVTTVQPYNSEDARSFLLASAGLTNPFESNWSIANDGGGTSRYKVCNPVLKLLVKGAVETLDERVDGLDERVDGLDERVDGLDERVDNAVFEDAEENLTEYEDIITGAFIRASNHTIEVNQYTANYRIYLFRLQAGDYIFGTTGASPNSVDVIGIINSVADFRVGGVLSEVILAGSPATSVSRTFNEETLVVLLSATPLSINVSGYIKRPYKTNRIDGLEERVSEIEEQITSSLKLTIPDTVYAIVGTEINIWNDAVSLSIDKGLASPLNYQIRWRCNKGIITDRCFRFTPTSGDVGNVSCTCFLYDMRGELVDSKTFTIKVLSKNALQSAKNIVYFGDSLGESAAGQLYLDFHNADKFSGIAPLMCGTRGTTPKYEAVGGYKWSDYATEGRTAYRASVSGVTSISLGAVYSDGAANFLVIEVNITDGIGNILLQSHHSLPGTLIMPSGTLTKVSGGGDETIPYTDAFAESANPLWNDTTQELDVNQFKQMVGLQSTDKFDAVSFQFGVNEAARSNLDDILTNIDALYHCFVDDNPDCKFIIGLNTTSGNDVNGAGNNYGAAFNTVSYLDNSYKIRQLYLTLHNNADYPNIRIAPIGLEVDRYYGYAFSTRQISQRYTENEQYHNNYVHPGTSGYGQMGDAYFAAYIGALTES